MPLLFDGQSFVGFSTGLRIDCELGRCAQAPIGLRPRIKAPQPRLKLLYPH